MIRTLGCPELPDPPICLRVGILHSRAVGIDVEVHLCSCFREAQHCGYFVCSLGGFLDAAAGVNTKPSPVRGSGSPRLPGSSPRVRGKPERGHPVHELRRLIPARAGKTQGAVGAEGQGEAHPRACGENGTGAGGERGRSGSSPRVRGKPRDSKHANGEGRLIPARAGKTDQCEPVRPCCSAHPRACGENWANAGKTVPFEGSSPRVRGKLITTNWLHLRLGLIPARAGKTSTQRG